MMLAMDAARGVRRQLWAAANAHFSIRRLAQRVAEEIRKVHQLLAKYMKLPEEMWQGVKEEFFVG